MGRISSNLQLACSTTESSVSFCSTHWQAQTDGHCRYLLSVVSAIGTVSTSNSLLKISIFLGYTKTLIWQINCTKFIKWGQNNNNNKNLFKSDQRSNKPNIKKWQWIVWETFCVSAFFHLLSRSRPIIRVNCGRRFRGFRLLKKFPPTLLLVVKHNKSPIINPTSTTKTWKQLDNAAILSWNCKLQSCDRALTQRLDSCLQVYLACKYVSIGNITQLVYC